MSIKRRTFSKEFKLHVLREVQSGKTQAEIARKYQILPKLISRWLCERETYAEEAFAGQGNTYTDKARIAALERKVAQLETENDLLKKALTQLDLALDLGARSGEGE
jgi:transposase